MSKKAKPSDTIYIYALKDPFTDDVRYVGKSVRPRERLTNQCNEKSNTYRCHWIQSVIRAGSRPIQVILEELPAGSDWQSAEKRWIAYGREHGWPLTNSTDGGDGVEGLSGESKQRMLQTWKGRKHKPESLEKIGQASRGRKHTQEYKDMMREKMSKRNFSPEHRQRISRSVSRFTDDDVREIRRLLDSGMMVKDIAAKYGVHRTTISNLRVGKFYKDAA